MPGTCGRPSTLTNQYIAASVAGDGNCLFRAVSLALFGRESAYDQLRLLAVIEVLTHRDFYDVTSSQFYEPYCKDLHLVLPSSLFVTVTDFRHRKIVPKTIQEAPIFLGPMMLHGDGKFATYLNFFSTVCGALNSNCVDAAELRVQDSVITGSDEESALVNALRTAFPQSQQLYCMRTAAVLHSRRPRIGDGGGRSVPALIAQ